MTECPYCGGEVVSGPIGRPRRWCSRDCRNAGHLEARRLEGEVDYLRGELVKVGYGFADYKFDPATWRARFETDLEVVLDRLRCLEPDHPGAQSS
jgi:hypothetical protein